MLLPKFKLKGVLVLPHIKRATKNNSLHVEWKVVRIVSVITGGTLGVELMRRKQSSILEGGT